MATDKPLEPSLFAQNGHFHHQEGHLYQHLSAQHSLRCKKKKQEASVLKSFALSSQHANNAIIVGVSYPQLATATAVLRGSRASGGGGLLLVFTAQNRQPRVQVSPRSMIVAVAMPSPSPPAPPPPFQH